ncbi:hypothetical protein HK102_010887 [Quaeritorhiza haematococci]|nr:hypothetical protein HK102_010887 [Quaeritorhiza haematococci]
MDTINLAILSCDIPPPAVMQEYGDYSAMFNRIFTEAASTTGRKLNAVSFDVTQMQYPNDPNDFHFYLLTESSSYEDLPWINKLKDFVRVLFTKPNIKIIGICFGHQIIAEALGGKVAKNTLGWEVGWTEMKITDAGKKILNTSRSSLRINSMHQDIVTVVPPDMEVLASSDKCAVQSMFLKNRILTIQGHPEFTAEIVNALVNMRLARGIFLAEFAADVKAKMDLQLDNAFFTEKMLSFFVSSEISADREDGERSS